MKAARLSVMMVGLMLVGVPAWAQDEGGATPDQADSAQEQEADSTASSAPRVKLETTLGDIVLELDGEKAPVSTHNFLQYTHDKFYDGTIFHRVMVVKYCRTAERQPDFFNTITQCVNTSRRLGLQNSGTKLGDGLTAVIAHFAESSVVTQQFPDGRIRFPFDERV